MYACGHVICMKKQTQEKAPTTGFEADLENIAEKE